MNEMRMVARNLKLSPNRSLAVLLPQCPGKIHETFCHFVVVVSKRLAKRQFIHYQFGWRARCRNLKSLVGAESQKNCHPVAVCAFSGLYLDRDGLAHLYVRTLRGT
jgi:hypothetical protein